VAIYRTTLLDVRYLLDVRIRGGTALDWVACGEVKHIPVKLVGSAAYSPRQNPNPDLSCLSGNGIDALGGGFTIRTSSFGLIRGASKSNAMNNHEYGTA
jgi:hypothetical protein